MGMNYYLVKKSCPTCGVAPEKKHIGKSSCGWQFHFRGYIEEGIISFLDWIMWMQKDGYTIIDENEKVIDVHEFIDMCKKKKNGIGHYNVSHNLSMNQAEQEYLRERPAHVEYSQECWKDDDGNSFSKGGFS